MAWEPPKELRKCPFHPDVEMVWVQKHQGKTKRSKLWWVERCDECEWNPPDIPSAYDTGKTSLDIPDVLAHWDTY